MSDLTQVQFAYILQFMHAEKILTQFPFVNDHTVASLFGLEENQYRSIRQKSMVQAQNAAKELLDESEFPAMVDAIHLKPGSTIVGVGDSFIDDDQSWLEILRNILEIRRPQDKFIVVNAGISMQTSSQIVSRFQQVLAMQPAQVIFMLGANDAQRVGPSPIKTLVSPFETKANFEYLKDQASIQTNLLWITPTPVIEEKIESHWMLGNSGSRWLNEDLKTVAELMRHMEDPVIDLHTTFGCPVNPALLLEDGLHPSLTGHKHIAREVVQALSK